MSSTMSRNQNGDQQQSTTSVKQFGVTPAASLVKPSLKSLQRTEELHNSLKSYKVFESLEGNINRFRVLATLQYLVREWIVGYLVERYYLIELIAEEYICQIYTMGAFRIGVHEMGAGIEVLCVAPKHFARKEFFCLFLGILKQHVDVTECRAIQEVSIKMKMYGIEVELRFARFGFDKIPHNLNLKDDNILRGIGFSSVRSLSGLRLPDQIIDLVPNPAMFSLTFHTIKLWARKNGILSVSFGYFGTVGLAILVARTCQLYPNATASTLVNKFFLVFSRWKWPNPVLLKHPDNFNLNFPVWNPRVNASDRNHLMPIITPAYPQQNSTFNVSESTKKIMMIELNRGLNITNDIMSGLVQWERLFKAPSFFFRYQQFLVLIVNSQSAKDHADWCCLIELKIRYLAIALEEYSHISKVRGNPRCFEYKKNNIIVTTSGVRKDISDVTIPITESPYSSMWFLGLEINSSKQSLKLDITEKVQCFYDFVYMHAEKLLIFKKGMNIDARHVKRKHLSQYLSADFLESERKSMEIPPNLSHSKLPASMLTISKDHTIPKRPRGAEKQRLT